MAETKISQSQVKNLATNLLEKQDIIQYSTMPTPSAIYIGKVIQYIGADDLTSGYKHGFFYGCVEDTSTTPSTYSWQNIPFSTVVINNLTSSDTDKSLSANMGKTLKDLIDGMSGVVQVKVVATQPETPENNTIYYIGTTSPYTIKLYTEEAGTGIWTDLGSSSIDLSQYMKFSDVIDNVTSTTTDKPLSANQGKLLNDKFADYCPKSGPVVSGDFGITAGHSIYSYEPTGSEIDSSSLILYGSADKDPGRSASLYLNSSNYYEEAQQGAFRLSASDPNSLSQATLRGHINEEGRGVLTWSHSSGVETEMSELTTKQDVVDMHFLNTDEAPHAMMGSIIFMGAEETPQTLEAIKGADNELTATNGLQITGGADNTTGATIELNGKSYNGGMAATNGGFAIRATNGSSTKTLIGKPDGTLTWNGVSLTTSCLPLTGGTMTGAIVSNVSNKQLITGTSDGDAVAINGGLGGTNTGGRLVLRGKTNSSAGTFSLYASDGTTTKELIGRPNGALTYGGNNIVRSNSNQTIRTFQITPSTGGVISNMPNRFYIIARRDSYKYLNYWDGWNNNVTPFINTFEDGALTLTYDSTNKTLTIGGTYQYSVTGIIMATTDYGAI